MELFEFTWVFDQTVLQYAKDILTKWEFKFLTVYFESLTVDLWGFLVTQHRCPKVWGSMCLACWRQECPPELLLVNWMLIPLLLINLQRHFRELGSTSSHQPRASTSSIFTSKIAWDQPPRQLQQQSVRITKEFLHKLLESPSQWSSSFSAGPWPDCSLLPEPTWVDKYSFSMVSGTLKRCPLHGWIHCFHCTGQMADKQHGVLCGSGLLMSVWIKWLMVAVGLWFWQAYVMDNQYYFSFFTLTGDITYSQMFGEWKTVMLLH